MDLGSSVSCNRHSVMSPPTSQRAATNEIMAIDAGNTFVVIRKGIFFIIYHSLRRHNNQSTSIQLVLYYVAAS